MGVGGGKLSPISGSGGSGVRESLTLASCKVFKGARSARSARRTSRDAAVAGGVAAPISPEPACSITPTGHFELNGGLSYLKLFVLA